MLNRFGISAGSDAPLPPAWRLSRPGASSDAAAAAVVSYAGPDRRRARAPEAGGWLAAALDELDYGVLLLTPEAEIVHINRAALVELDAGHPLQTIGRRLRARGATDCAALQDALRNACRRGMRKLVTLGERHCTVGVSVVPLAADPSLPCAEPLTLLLLGKRRVCETLSVQGFARSHGLTGAETRVLSALCDGASPNLAAEQLGVAISTVRTQIGSIRLKTGAKSIGALVRQVTQLPPLMGVLRPTAAVAAPPRALDRVVVVAASARRDTAALELVALSD